MKKNTKQIIFEKSIILFAKYGYNGTSIRLIAKKVGIKESSIYNHYSNKQKILQDILDYQINTFSNAIDNLEKLKKSNFKSNNLIDIWLKGIEEFTKKIPPISNTISKILINEMYLNNDCRNFVLNTMLKAQKKLTKKLLTDFYKQNLIKQNINIDKTAEQYVYMLLGLEIENNLKQMQGISEKETQISTINNIIYFISSIEEEKDD